MERLRPLAAGYAGLAGGVLIGIVVYVPLLVQGAWGSRPYEAGLIIAPLSLGWPIASSQVGKLLRNFSYRALAFGGSLIVFLGTLLLLLILVPLWIWWRRRRVPLVPASALTVPVQARRRSWWPARVAYA